MAIKKVHAILNTIFAKDNEGLIGFLSSTFLVHCKGGSVFITTVCCFNEDCATLMLIDSHTGTADSCISLPSAVFNSNCTSSPFIDLKVIYVTVNDTYS